MGAADQPDTPLVETRATVADRATDAEPTSSTTDLAPQLSTAAQQRIALATAAAKAPNTRAGYAIDFGRFERWCAKAKQRALPAHPHTVADYLTDAASTVGPDGNPAYSPDTLARWTAAIAHEHRAAGHGSPCSAAVVSDTLSGIRRLYAAAGLRRPRGADPLLSDEIRALVGAASSGHTLARRLAARRDAALILIGFVGALRSDELCAADGNDIVWHRHDGLHLILGRTKGSQEEAVTVAVPRATDPTVCPPCAWLRWRAVLHAHHDGGRGAVGLLIESETDAGLPHHICLRPPTAVLPDRCSAFRPIDRHGNVRPMALDAESLTDILRRHLTTLGYTTAEIKKFSGHSLRAGFVTAALRAGANERQIMRQTRHKSEAMVRRYQRENAPLVDNAVNSLPLL
ncbi:recombinase [Nocardia camponoti]|uniref:Integrase n=1 Tax=Nocardia camponoti TaxID=1616106 RepID=A0A917VEU8_9NOCA|nr:recombinase [Nocardia camponoti]GGK68556.1 integrase [Nocardia camponoti]